MTVDRSVPHGENREAPDLPRRLQRLAPPSPEPDYERLTAYAFAQRYVEGKTVADLGWGEIGRGSRLLAGTAVYGAEARAVITRVLSDLAATM